MGKPSRARVLEDDEVQSVSRMIRISPQKLNLVAQLIRGLGVEQATTELMFCRKRVAETVKKVLEAAIANAENNHGLDIDRLVVREAFVGKSIRMRRIRARAKGAAASIVKPYSRLTIILKESAS